MAGYLEISKPNLQLFDLSGATLHRATGIITHHAIDLAPLFTARLTITTQSI
jgi:hypothetical protein